MVAIVVAIIVWKPSFFLVIFAIRLDDRIQEVDFLEEAFIFDHTGNAILKI